MTNNDPSNSLSSIPMADPSPVWYENGLRFKCTECGKCCTGSPGYAWVSDEEIEKLATHFNLSLQEFGKRYLRYVNGRYALLENYQTYSCVFLKDNKCSVYQLRPKQCRTFPWWIQNLKTPEAWNEAAKSCEGISQEAPIITFEEINQNLNT